MAQKENNYDLSILLPLGRSESYFTKALHSVIETIELLKKEANLTSEVIISLDYHGGFIDGQKEIVNKLPHCKILQAPEAYAQGPAMTRNRALAAASGEYILTLDNDDYFEPAGVLKAWTTLKSSAASWVSARIHDVDSCGNFIWEGPNDFEPNHIFTIGSFLSLWQTTGIPFHPTASIVRRNTLILVGGWHQNIAFVRGEDIGLWLRVSEVEEGIWSNDVMIHHRSHDNSITQTDAWDEYFITPKLAIKYLHSEMPITGNFKLDLAFNQALVEFEKNLAKNPS